MGRPRPTMSGLAVTVPVSADLLGDTEADFALLRGCQVGDLEPIVKVMAEATLSGRRQRRSRG